MRPLLLLCVISFLLFINAAYVDCSGDKPYKLFVFGDSFVDTGNLPKLDRNVTRNWYYPYGLTWPLVPTGRFSNGMLQTDLMAKLLGIKTPPIYVEKAKYRSLPFGMNFAVAGSGVFEINRAGHDLPKLGQQIDFFEQMIKDGSIPKQDLQHSVALVAISGNDFSEIANVTDFLPIYIFILGMTNQVAEDLGRLPKLGFSKIIVNNMHPLGCMPWQSRPLNYTDCSSLANLGAALYNSNLTPPNNNSFLILDLNSAFDSLVNPSATNRTKEFEHKLEPCCESFDINGYCGQKDVFGVNQYKLCSDPWNYFYWDGVHPTQDGWEAVMGELQGPIKKFLGI